MAPDLNGSEAGAQFVPMSWRPQKELVILIYR